MLSIEYYFIPSRCWDASIISGESQAGRICMAVAASKQRYGSVVIEPLPGECLTAADVQLECCLVEMTKMLLYEY